MPPVLTPTPHGPTAPERLSLRALQLGALLVVLVAATYKVFELDRFFVPKELVLHLTALLAGGLALGAARRSVATRVDVLLAGFLLLSAVSAAAATNPWLSTRALAVSTSGVALFWTGRALRGAGLSRPLATGLALAVALASATALLQTYGVRSDFFSINRAPGGTLGNRNFIAHLMAFGLPLLLLAALRAWRSAGFLLGSLGLALATGSLVLSRSRAAWLALVAVGLVTLAGVLVCRPVRRHRRTLARLSLLILFAAAGVAAVLVLPNELRWRSDSPYLETARGVVNYQEGSGRGRLLQYRNSLRMAAQHPILGVGPGNWGVEYPDHARRGDPSLDGREAGRTANPWPSSDWVALVAERGFPAALLFLLAGAGIAVAAARRLSSARDAEEGLEALTVIGILAGIAVVGAFDAALLLAWPTLVVWTALGALWSPDLARPVAVGPSLRAAALGVLVLAAAAGAVRSAGQVAAMALFSTDGSRAALERAAALDPGNYRVRMSLARAYTGRANRERRCEHALAARDLYPNAQAARQMAGRCE